MKICIIGTGYVGLVTGACFAHTGNTVICVDKDKSKIGILNDGHIPIYEPGLEVMVMDNVQKKRLRFTTETSEGINQADVNFIAVGTPQGKDGTADLKYVNEVCEEICTVAKKEVLIATKSTVPVGTGDKIESLFKARLKYPFAVFSNPEFLKEGDAVNDCLKPHRVIIGTDNERVRELMRNLYAPFMHQMERIIFMSRRSAEITKYAANAMLSVRIGFMNELARFCDAAGANIAEVRRGLGADPRIGPAFLFPSLGYGGSCFPKDVKALIRAAHDHKSPLSIMEACDESNDRQVAWFFDKICAAFGGVKNLAGKTFAVWGLAFKANTDDTRESRSLKLIDHLLGAGTKVRANDPQAMANTRERYQNTLTYCEDHMDCLNGAHALIIATEWSEYRSPDFTEVKKRLNGPRIFDGRNLYDPEYVKKLGFQYVGVGV